MSDDAIFLVQEGELVVLRRTVYDSEDLLQEVLARFPEVLAGGAGGSGRGGGSVGAGAPEDDDPDDDGGSDDPRLLLVAREQGVPGTAGGAGRWSADHLFLDADAVPVIVEVKRHSDTRLRREVVGQMLDYAANGVRYWEISELRAAVTSQASQVGLTHDEYLFERLRVSDAQSFWEQVEANLAAGRIRLVFVADQLADELVRIIEFLAEQLSPAEVLGVELPQYVGGGQQVLVPRVVGSTRRSRRTSTSRRDRWTEQSLLAEAEAFAPAPVLDLLRRLLGHARTVGAGFRFGRAPQPAVSLWYPLLGSGLRPTLYVQARTSSPTPTVGLSFYDISRDLDRAAFDRIADGLSRISSLAEVVETDPSTGRRSLSGRAIDLANLAADPDALDRVIELLDSITEPGA